MTFDHKEFSEVVGGSPLGGVVCRPGLTPAPVVLILPAVAGINPYIQRIMDELADEGFASLALDYYHDRESTPILDTPEKVVQTVQELDDDEIRDSVVGALMLLAEDGTVDSTSVATLGFCVGGAYALFASVDSPGLLKCAVSFYGLIRYEGVYDAKRTSVVDVAEAIDCPVLGHFGSEDHRIPDRHITELGEELGDTPHEIYVYPGAGHAFHEEFRPSMYRPAAAMDAWQRTLAYFHWYLRSVPYRRRYSS